MQNLQNLIKNSEGKQGMSRQFKRIWTTLLAIALLVPQVWSAGSAEAADPEIPATATIYHETFANGTGVAYQSGGASLSQVTGKVFDGNADGKALYVSNRSNDYDAADFDFDDLGMINGKTYSITIKGYVDSGVTVPEGGSQAFLQTIGNYGWLGGATFSAGNAFTLTGTYTVDTSTASTLRIQSNSLGAPVPFYIGDILITTPNPIYSESFGSGVGIAQSSGDAILAQATGIAFDGNDDGTALSVTSRVFDYSGVDFRFSDLGLKVGNTYSVTASVYVPADASVPGGAQATIQTVDSYQNWKGADITAGSAVSLTQTFTVASGDTALRIQTNNGPSVPFYIGNIAVSQIATPPETEEPESGTVEIYHETFATNQGYASQSGDAVLARVTGKTFTGNDDGFALSVTNRSKDYDAVDFSLTNLKLEMGKTYTMTVTGYVDAGTTIPDDAQVFIKNVPSYGAVASADFVAGQAFTMTGQYTVNDTDTTLRVQSNAEGASVPFYIGDVLVTGPAPSAKVMPYYESFESGKGIATANGGASVTAVANKPFAGNGDEGALYVTNRSNNWDAADFSFGGIGLETGKTYTAIVKGYVDPNVTVPAGAKAYLQTVDGDNYGYLAEADFEAGQTFTMIQKFTVNSGNDTKLRVQSNDTGKDVPFYIGFVFVTDKNLNTITFENGMASGFTPRGSETVAVVSDENHTEGGSKALKVSNRTENWHGPSLSVVNYVDQGHEYKVSAWVKLISPESTTIRLSTQVGSGSGASYPNIASKTVTTSDGWAKLEGTYRYSGLGGGALTIYVESSNATASYLIDDISFENTGAGLIVIQNAIDSIKDVYQNDFLIGSAISAEDLEFVRLDLLKKHHNVATAGNAMKPDALQNVKGSFTWTAADNLIANVHDAGMDMHGHVLVWHQQTPAWMNTNTTTNLPLSRSEALDNMRTHIKTVMEHFQNNVISWDVVNEAMNDNPPNPEDWQGSLRQSDWYKSIGPDFVEEAFLAARAVLDDPANASWANGIKLYYNDYNEDNQNKADAIYYMVKDINDRYKSAHNGKLLIDGIGMQGHYNVFTNPANVEMSLTKFASLGVEISISELDVTAGANYEMSDVLEEAQGYLYAQLMDIFKRHSDVIARVTFWGLDDATSWRADQNPLLFNKDLQAKLAYYAVVDPIGFMANHEPLQANARQSTAKYATPVIDGSVDTAWNDAPAMTIDRYQMAWQGASGTAKALWDDHNLYILVQVHDTVLDKSSANPWEQDSVEIFLDQNNAKSTSYQSDDGQFRVNFDNEQSFGASTNTVGFVSATQQSGANYTIEVKIPLSSITPANNTNLGFDVQINDGQSGSRQSTAAWNAYNPNGYQDTSVFGLLTLTGKTVGNTDNVITPPTTNEPKADPSTGAVTIKASVTTSNGVVSANVSSSSLENALKQATANAAGKKQVVVDVPAQAGATAYGVQLPVSGLKDSASSVISIKTENGTVDLPGNMLEGTDVGNAGDVTVRVGKVNADSLSEEVRKQIGDKPVINLEVLAGDSVIAWNNPNAAVSVAIPYTPTAQELSNLDHIIIWYIDGSGKATPVPNARYDAASGTVKFSTTHFSNYAVAFVVKTFDDLKSVPWAKKAIEAMASRGIINGTSEQTYDPNASIKRADFLALLVRALELRGSDESVTMFSDVASSAYYYDAVNIAKQLGIIQGTGSNQFDPNSSISRQDMMVIAVRAMKAAGKALPAGSTLSAFSDAGSVAAYAKESAAALVQAGIVEGSGGKLAPNGSLTRAEAAVILQRIWSK
mgnify:CR=1 FL=1